MRQISTGCGVLASRSGPSLEPNRSRVVHGLRRFSLAICTPHGDGAGSSETLAQHIEQGFTASDGSVFSAPEGGPLRPRNFRRRVFAPAVRTAGIVEGFRIHDLRHTCAALLIAQGAGPKEIAERLGPSSPVVTMTVYAHVLPSLDERLTDGLEATFRGAVSKMRH
jgi:hypothetical protein